MRLCRPGKPEEAAADGQSVICHLEGKSLVLCCYWLVCRSTDLLLAGATTLLFGSTLGDMMLKGPALFLTAFLLLLLFCCLQALWTVMCHQGAYVKTQPHHCKNCCHCFLLLLLFLMAWQSNKKLQKMCHFKECTVSSAVFTL